MMGRLLSAWCGQSFYIRYVLIDLQPGFVDEQGADDFRQRFRPDARQIRLAGVFDGKGQRFLRWCERGGDPGLQPRARLISSWLWRPAANAAARSITNGCRQSIYSPFARNACMGSSDNEF